MFPHSGTLGTKWLRASSRRGNWIGCPSASKAKHDQILPIEKNRTYGTYGTYASSVTTCFGIRHSSFVIRHSSFVIRHSSFHRHVGEVHRHVAFGQHGGFCGRTPSGIGKCLPVNQLTDLSTIAGWPPALTLQPESPALCTARPPARSAVSPLQPGGGAHFSRSSASCTAE